MPHFFSARKILFPGQQEAEQVHLVMRQHWVILTLRLLLCLLFALGPIFFDAFAAPAWPELASPNIAPMVNLVKILYLMLAGAVFMTIWVIYYLNYYIVTNERIVDITQRNILYHTTSELTLGRIQDVTAEIKGAFGTFFDYGDVYVQTAGETARFEFVNVPHPNAVAKLILDLYEQLPKEDQLGAEGDRGRLGRV